MKNKPLLIAIFYSVAYIIATLYFYYSERYALFNIVYLLSMALILPLVILTVKIQRDAFGGYISGKSAVREGMKFVLYSVFILVVFQCAFYFAGWREFKTESLPIYIREKALELDKLGKRKFDEKQLQQVIVEETKNITLFKELTFVFFRCIFVGLFSSFLTAALMKRSKPANTRH